MKNAVRALLLLVGLALFGWFLHKAGLAHITEAFKKLGWYAPTVLLPFLVVYGADTLGWLFAFGRNRAPNLDFFTLFRIRWAGEAVNNVIPSAYIGGEAVKVYLLRKRGTPMSEAVASVIAGKTVQTLAQLIFILLGAFAFMQLESTVPGVRKALAGVLVVGLLVVVLLFGLQSYGLVSLLFDLIERLRIKHPALLAWKEKLQFVDRQLLAFYRQDRGHFILCFLSYLTGWLLEVAEIYLVAYLVEIPISALQAVAVAAFVAVAKAMGLMVPGALGIQESGIFFLCASAGLPDLLGVAYAIVRRGREAVYAALGWIILYTEAVSWKEIKKAGEVAS